MKQRRNSVKTEQDNNSKLCSDFNYFPSSSTNLLCKKHPLNPSSVGICAYCLKEKLIKLVCSDCGEQRISSCSCNDISSYRNSSCSLDFGNVRRFSVLNENENGNNGVEQKTLFSYMKQTRKSETEGVVLLQRSSSCVVDVKKNIAFWKIGKFFKKKREKQSCSERNRGGFDQSSFMDGNFESAKVSDFDEIEPRKSGLTDLKSGFSVRESDFSKMDDDSEFIDLNVQLFDNKKQSTLFSRSTIHMI